MHFNFLFKAQLHEFIYALPEVAITLPGCFNTLVGIIVMVISKAMVID